MVMDLSGVDRPENERKQVMFKYCIFFWDKAFQMHVFSPEFDGRRLSWDVKDIVDLLVQLFYT